MSDTQPPTVKDSVSVLSVSEELLVLRGRVAELESVCRLLANVVSHLPAGEVERLILLQIAKGFPLVGINLPCGERS